MIKKPLTLSKNFNLYDKILGFLIKRGHTEDSISLLTLAFSRICELINRPINYLLVKMFILLNIFVETKTIKTRSRLNIVPFPLNLKRRIHLILKWIFFVIKKDKANTSFVPKFVKEILSILKEKKSEVFKIRATNNSKALLNRSNIHYRW